MDMDPAVIAAIGSTAVALLIPYLKSLSEGFAKKAGEKLGEKSSDLAWVKAEQVHELVKTKLAAEPNADSPINALEAAPNDPDVQDDVRGQLEESIASDDGFARQLAGLLKEADDAGADAFFNTNIHGNVEKFVQMRDVYGDVNL